MLGLQLIFAQGLLNGKVFRFATQLPTVKLANRHFAQPAPYMQKPAALPSSSTECPAGILKPCGRLSRLLLASGMVLVLGACGTSPSTPKRSDTGAVRQVQPVTSAQADDVTIYALGLVGTPYRYGGNTPESGFDCSGLIGHVYASRAGSALPRSVAGLQHWGQAIPAEDLRSGDLVLFGPLNAASHAGIYVGEGRFVHAPSSGGVVRLDSLHSKYWASLKTAFRRL